METESQPGEILERTKKSIQSDFRCYLKSTVGTERGATEEQKQLINFFVEKGFLYEC